MESNDQEQWQSIPGWEGFYEVSDAGRIRSVRRLSRVNSVTPDRKRMMGGKIRKLQTLKDGYLGCWLTAEGRREHIRVHHAVLMAFKGMRKDSQIARHINGNPCDNRPENLEWGTHQENMVDRKSHGNYARGSRHVMAILTEEAALYIKNSAKKGVCLAAMCGVSTSTISNIRRGRTWRHL